MAPLSNYISFLFLTTLLLPLQIIARDSQFFNKVTYINNNNKETEVSNKEGPVTNKPEEQQQPAFIPETENSYGLYGHDSDHLPTKTTTNAAPYKTEFEDTSKYPNNNNNKYFNKKYYNKDAFGNNQNELSDTKYTEGGYNSMGNHNNNKKQYYFNNNAAANERYYSNNNNNNYNVGANNRYNGERQGMSDTRFLENGKYFYDVSYEKYNPTFYGDSSRGVNTNNWYNNRGGNNNVYHGNYNAYQNQDEFEDEQYDFEP